MKEIVCPAFFRLLYSSGIRTTEARLLEREDIDLSHGVINVRHSKGYDQHYIALHESMTSILLQYDAAAEKSVRTVSIFLNRPWASIIPGNV
jgi:site-specific recombinase XerD